MKFLIIQENGRHEISKHLRECNSMQRALVYNGAECDVWGLGHENFNITPSYEKYDAIINLENYDTGWMPNLSHVKSPLKFLWAIDSHCRGQDYYDMVFNEGKYNYILQATKYFCKDKSLWFPNCYDDDFLFPTENEKKHLIGFCGNVVNRGSLLQHLASIMPFKIDIDVRGEEMINVIKSYKIHFNKNISVDVNYRNFETMGCGTLLLTDHNEQYSELGFKPETNVFVYKNIEEAVEIINYLKDKEDVISEVATKGQEFVKSKHTFRNRAKHLIKFINSL